MKTNEAEFLAQMALGYFRVDADGTIWRCARSVGGSRTGSPSYMKMIRPSRADRSESHGYTKVMFTALSRVRLSIYAHRVVWMVANHAEIPESMEINHKDGNPRNNRPDNLEVVTRQENALHAGRVLRVLGKKNQYGEKNTSAKLTPLQVVEIRRICAGKELSQGVIAAMFGVSQRTVSEIHLRKTWKHIP